MALKTANSIPLLRCAALLVFLAPSWLDMYRKANALQLGGRSNASRQNVAKMNRQRLQRKNNGQSAVQGNSSRRRYRTLDQDDEKLLPQQQQPFVVSKRKKSAYESTDFVSSIEDYYSAITSLGEIEAAHPPPGVEEKKEPVEKKGTTEQKKTRMFLTRKKGRLSAVRVDNAKLETTVKPKDTSTQRIVVSSVEELRMAVLEKGYNLRDIDLSPQLAQITKRGRRRRRRRASVENDTPEEDETISQVNLPLDHEVLKLITKRAQSGSTPDNRDVDDDARLALSIEGGGMRGAVSAGMVAAIAALGLSDVFDSIYGSSAGSTVGAYFVSRQMCFDVYTHILPEAKTTFVSKKRIMTSLVRNLADVLSSRSDSNVASEDALVPSKTSSNKIEPGMNISFVLDGIMCSQNGVRPLDLELFRKNDAKQPLRIVSSTVRDGRMETICFGSDENDFFDNIEEDTAVPNNVATTSTCGERHGLYACLQASMTVPGATGPPINLVRNVDQGSNVTCACFDAFCYEPVPYRSAVKEGATHVLALRTRPEGSHMKTRPGVYERAVAPIYFRSHGQPEVAKFFENGGQQYIYLEDILTLDEARYDSSDNGVPVPPPTVLYGIDLDKETRQIAHSRDSWKRAHLFPVVVPYDTPELSTLSQDKDEVLNAIRGGFASAFDLLAPAAGLDLEEIGLSAERVAELLFPDIDPNDTAPEKTKGTRADSDSATAAIEELAEEAEEMKKRKKFRGWLKGRVLPLRRKERDVNHQRPPELAEELMEHDSPPTPCKRRDARSLLDLLPTEPWTISQLSLVLEDNNELA